MAKEKAKTRSFDVHARMNLLVSISISAQSLDEAVEASKKMAEEDFVDFIGDYVDGEFRISGIFES